MSELYGYMDDGDVLNGGMEEIAKVVGHSDWGEIGGQLKDQTDLQEALDKKADKARVDILEKLTLGQVWDYDEHTETVYQQAVPAGGHGVEMESVGGRSVVWNQQAKQNSVNIEETSTESIKSAFVNETPTPGYKTHKYVAIYNTNGIGIFNMLFNGLSSEGYLGYNVSLTAEKQRHVFINSPLHDVSSIYEFRVFPQDGIVKIDVSSICICDMTLMFGSGNEPTSISDPRIAWIEQYAEAHPEYNAGEVIHGAVSAIVESGTADTPISYPIPAEVQALEGYGWSAGSVFNEVDFKEKKFIKRAGKITNLGALSWSIRSAGAGVQRFVANYDASVKKPPSTGTVANIVCEKFIAVSADNTWLGSKIGIAVNTNAAETNPMLCIYDSSIGTAESLKSLLAGVPLYYELATPIETDISAYIDDSWQAIPTEPNGSITFQNDNLLPVPVKDAYMVKLSEAL